jgi:hypothetical protein
VVGIGWGGMLVEWEKVAVGCWNDVVVC